VSVMRASAQEECAREAQAGVWRSVVAGQAEPPTVLVGAAPQARRRAKVRAAA